MKKKTFAPISHGVSYGVDEFVSAYEVPGGCLVRHTEISSEQDTKFVCMAFVPGVCIRGNEEDGWYLKPIEKHGYNFD